MQKKKWVLGNDEDIKESEVVFSIPMNLTAADA